MALAFTGLSFGVIFGPPFGGIMYQLVNKTAPFLTICFFTLIDGCRYDKNHKYRVIISVNTAKKIFFRPIVNYDASH